MLILLLILSLPKFENADLTELLSALSGFPKPTINILEKLLLDEMYESPSRKDIEQIIIDKENVTDDIQPKMVLKEKKESKDSKPA